MSLPRDWVVTALPALWLGTLIWNQGGYFPSSWGWAALAALWLVAGILFVRPSLDWGRFDVAMAASFVLLTAWVALSLTWSDATHPAVLDLERVMLYALAVPALLLLVRADSAARLLAGVCLAIVVVSTYALGTRLFPERLGVIDPIAPNRLSEPVGYWNGLGLLVAIGLLLALGFAARSSNLVTRALAGSVAPMLLCTLYFTFSRGAVFAFASGLVVWLLFDPRRPQALGTLIAAGAPAGVATWLASRSEPLTTQAAELAAAAEAGRRIALIVLLASVVSALAVIAIALVERRLSVGYRFYRALSAAVAAAPLVAAATVVAAFGGPVSVADRVRTAFNAPPPTPTDLNERLINLSGNGRADLWSVAWERAQERPWHGWGAGQYERLWLADRPGTLQVRDAHNLYLETLVEIGIVGLVLLGIVLALPLVASFSARRAALVPAAVGAYSAFLVHAFVDWDWELTGVILAVLGVAAALVTAARRRRDSELPGTVRVVGIAAAVLLAPVVLAGVVGNTALARAETALDEGRWADARDQADTAARWMPWSHRPLVVAGEAELGAGATSASRSTLLEALETEDRDWRLWYDLALATSGAERRRAVARAQALNPRGHLVVRLQRELAGNG